MTVSKKQASEKDIDCACLQAWCPSNLVKRKTEKFLSQNKGRLTFKLKSSLPVAETNIPLSLLFRLCQSPVWSQQGDITS